MTLSTEIHVSLTYGGAIHCVHLLHSLSFLNSNSAESLNLSEPVTQLHNAVHYVHHHTAWGRVNVCQ